MSLYREAIRELNQEDLVKEMYRFQGANSYEHFNIKTSKYNQNTIDNYLYFSKSIDHHEYFTIKRIRQLLNKLLEEETDYKLTLKELGESNSYTHIKNFILNTEKLEDLYSIKLVTNKNIDQLLKENSFKLEEKRKPGSVEKVDRRVYGGGYGITKEWKELLYALTYFTSFHTIDKKDIIELLQNMRRTGRLNRKDNIDFILKNPENYKFQLSPSIQSDFTKYQIINCLEEILENGTYIKESELGQNPTKTIRKIIDDYERGKEKVLTIFDNYYINR